MRVTVLGSGSSGGTPVVGTGWGKCDPNNPRNIRTRPSILIERNAKTFLVDTSPDLRQQTLTADATRLDAVIYTHAHADHLHGIDDLRGINRAMEAPIAMFADQATIDQIADRFSYALEPLPKRANGYFYKPTLEVNEISPGDAIDVAGEHFDTFDQDHGYSRTLGLRIGSFAYSTDFISVSARGLQLLEGVHTWLIGVFSPGDHPTHVGVERAIAYVERVKPERAIFTHLGPDLDFGDLERTLPAGIEPAYDGMIIDVPDA